MIRHDVVLVRHGETEWSASGRHTGRTDLPLTVFGTRQAAALADMLTGRRFAAVVSSPLVRARATAERSGLGASVTLDDDLMEWDYGAYEGRSTREIREMIPGWSVWTHPIAGGESLDEVAVRADRVVSRVREAAGPVALFAHGHILRVLAARWLGASPDLGASLGLDPATLSVLGWERDRPVIRGWNEACHLRSVEE